LRLRKGKKEKKGKTEERKEVVLCGGRKKERKGETTGGFPLSTGGEEGKRGTSFSPMNNGGGRELKRRPGDCLSVPGRKRRKAEGGEERKRGKPHPTFLMPTERGGEGKDYKEEEVFSFHPPRRLHRRGRGGKKI